MHPYQEQQVIPFVHVKLHHVALDSVHNAVTALCTLSSATWWSFTWTNGMTCCSLLLNAGKDEVDGKGRKARVALAAVDGEHFAGSCLAVSEDADVVAVNQGMTGRGPLLPGRPPPGMPPCQTPCQRRTPWPQPRSGGGSSGRWRKPQTDHPSVARKFCICRIDPRTGC